MSPTATRGRDEHAPHRLDTVLGGIDDPMPGSLARRPGAADLQTKRLFE